MEQHVVLWSYDEAMPTRKKKIVIALKALDMYKSSASN